MEAAESVLRAGYRLDRYELLCPIASGGMATVWLARLRGKRGFEKLFAIKTIRTELVDDPRFQEMFLDEARIASGIQHPNVAQILDLGEQADVLFIVMEWVDGDSLAKIRKLVTKGGGKLPTGVVLRVLADACSGLHAAHELRDDEGHHLEVVHRDVSPQNILVGTAGAVKVIDFGIAKAHNRRQGTTRTGIVKGKIQYMAPEQVRKGKSVDRRADIWALGVTLHELVAGVLPYDGDDDVEVIRRLMADEPPSMASGIPDAIASVLARSVVLDPDARFPTAAGMQRAIEAAMKELGETATSEDVAAFVRSELPDLAQKRRDIVTRAIEDARERGTPTAGMREPDVAFAPTIMSERQAMPDTVREPRVGTIPLTRRKDSPAPRAPTVPTMVAEDSRLASSLDQEPIEIPKRSRAWLWAVLVLGGGIGAAAAAFPATASRLLGAIGLGGGATQATETALPSAAPAAPSSSEASNPALPPPPSSPVPTGAAPASPAVASATASAGSPALTPRRLDAGGHHTWPMPAASASVRALPSALLAPSAALAPIPLLAPSASAPAASASASAGAPVPAPPPASSEPASTEDDQNDPYK
jgi:serine/threonine-protein kinase